MLTDIIFPIFYRQALLGNNLGPLPPGWEEARTHDGKLYYGNHITKSTQWEDPRITLSQSIDQNNHIAQVGVGANGPLPSGWEQGVTNEGQIYFIDHRTNRTQWHDPRITLSQQVPHRLDSNYWSLYLKKLFDWSCLIFELIYQVIQNHLQQLP